LDINLEETIWLSGLIIEFVVIILWAYTSKGKYTFFQPPLFLSLIFFYYVIGGLGISPLLDLDFIDRGINLRSGLVFALKGTFIFYTSFLFSYFTNFGPVIKKRETFINPFIGKELGRFFNICGLLLFFLVAGKALFILILPINLNVDISNNLNYILGGQSGGLLGPFTNYGSLAINFLIPGNLLLIGYYFKTNKLKIEVILWFLITFGIYTSLGFRYRILILLAGIFCLRFFAKNIKIKPIKSFFPLTLIILFLGLIGETRNYGLGLSLDRVSGVFNILGGLFNEAKVFLSTGKIISFYPDTIDFIGLKPIFNAILSPIPSVFLRNKGGAEYLTEPLAKIYGGVIEAKGASLLNFGEYYIMFGWISVIVIGLLIGFLYRFLWLWFIQRKDELLAQVIYVTHLSYIYVLISRGYTTQVLMLYFFTVYPTIFYYYTISNKIKNNS